MMARSGPDHRKTIFYFFNGFLTKKSVVQANYTSNVAAKDYI